MYSPLGERMILRTGNRLYSVCLLGLTQLCVQRSNPRFGHRLLTLGSCEDVPVGTKLCFEQRERCGVPFLDHSLPSWRLLRTEMVVPLSVLTGLRQHPCRMRRHASISAQRRQRILLVIALAWRSAACPRSSPRGRHRCSRPTAICRSPGILGSRRRAAGSPWSSMGPSAHREYGLLRVGDLGGGSGLLSPAARPG